METGFSLTFGKIPLNYIERQNCQSRIINDFSLSFPVSHIYIIQGVRGVGKTVLLSAVAKEMKQDEDWIVIDVNNHRDVLEQLAAELYESAPVKHLFLQKELSFSFHGVTFSLEGKEPISNARALCTKMLNAVKRMKKRVLITIDEVSDNENIRSFALDFQSFLREDYPLFCLMTGLVENVTSLTDDPVCTFLARAPKISLGSLNLPLVEQGFISSLHVDANKAKELASLSQGYAFAYQVIGLLYSEIGQINEQFLREFDTYLENFVYGKIWEKLPRKEREFLQQFDGKNEISREDFLSSSLWGSNEYCVYRDRLKGRGVLVTPNRGILTIPLPRFGLFVQRKKE